LARHIADPLLAEMLLCPVMYYGSATPRDMPAAAFVVLFRSIFREGLARPHEGVRRLLKHLVRQYKALGGQLRLRAGVSRVLSRQGRAAGVRLDSGEEIACDTILSSAGLVETRALCDPAAWKEEPGQGCAAGELTFFESVLVLDAAPADLGFEETIIFFCNSPQFHYENPNEPCDLRSGIVCTPNNFAYDRPLREGMLRITALANKDYWMNLPPEQYACDKAHWHARLVEASAARLGQLPARAIDVDTFTPRTIRHYTGHVNGAVYGSAEKRWNGTTGIERLFLCGTDQGYLGIIGAMLSGISMANRHVLMAAEA
jgi:phytoene dehydrogenase-like protein